MRDLYMTHNPFFLNRYQELEKPTTETIISHHYRSKVQNFSKMRVESIKSRKKGEEPFDNTGNMNSPSG
ncbi:hypothetical protein HID58_013394 [Brassica napus]|uniref:DET1- and DDB1-associated protein 1 n=1 Tax=Brassica napus TaxID=3708 RepID=A0ABQ8E4G3_BRANA|nr:hypothetical protein HID58_013394 [Brassica napus]